LIFSRSHMEGFYVIEGREGGQSVESKIHAFFPFVNFGTRELNR